MPIFAHQVPEDIREQSRWSPDYAAYRAPDGRWWKYSDDPEGRHVSWRDIHNQPLAVAVWLED